jgi:Phosphosulfolactate phosphohydrolase and related enzymes
LQLRVYFNPVELSFITPSEQDVYIVIDVMRATTTMTIMFEQGARQVLAAESLEQALASKTQAPDRLLCGERHTQTPKGFNHGNSPAFFAQHNWSEQTLVLTTSNGTRALFACPEQSTRLAGCFYNGTAVATLAHAIAQERHSNIAIVCGAEYGYFALEDSACAGYLAKELLTLDPTLTIHDSVYGAITLHDSYPPQQLIKKAQSALDLIEIGQQQDLDYCLKKNGSLCVPTVEGIEARTGLLQLSCTIPLPASLS